MMLETLPCSSLCLLHGCACRKLPILPMPACMGVHQWACFCLCVLAALQRLVVSANGITDLGACTLLAAASLLAGGQVGLGLIPRERTLKEGTQSGEAGGAGWKGGHTKGSSRICFGKCWEQQDGAFLFAPDVLCFPCMGLLKIF